MREIKFRQPIFAKGKFLKWHYWGVIGRDQFVGVIAPIEKAQKDSLQFTGLKDKSGTEIFEGDIVTLGEMGEVHFKGPVLMNNGCWCAKANERQTPILAKFVRAVIGNIYENKERHNPIK